MSTSEYPEPFPLAADATEYELITASHVETDSFRGRPMLVVEPQGLTLLARMALRSCSFLFRASHLQQLAAILRDPQASDNDRFVALSLLRNAEVAARGQLPMCQDTGTAAVHALKGQQVYSTANDSQALSEGIRQAYAHENLRYSVLAPLDMYQEVNTQSNLPAQIDIMAVPGNAYHFLFLAKGGGSANRTLLFNQSKALLNPVALEGFLLEGMRSLGVSACPPYHVAMVVGGLSPEACLKTVKLAAARYYDGLPTQGGGGGHAFRDLGLEARMQGAATTLGLGAQFGGKHFALDVRVIRLPRHGASCHVGIGVSCSADRQVKGRIDPQGIWLERLEANPSRFIPSEHQAQGPPNAVAVDLDRPMGEVLRQLAAHPVGTRLSLSGTIVVARDAAHARLMELLRAGGELPRYLQEHPVYYAGPAKTPQGMASGSFGPTTAGRMDAYVEAFQQHGASLVTIAKGSRAASVASACKRHGGFYLGSIGGAAALLARDHIHRVELIDFPELGMEAVYRIAVRDFPAFIIIDDKGNDFYSPSR